jgi:hypothetical protein
MYLIIKIAKILGKPSIIYIRTIFTKLLSDEEIEVLQIAFKNMTANLDQIYSDESQKKVGSQYNNSYSL